MAAISHIIAPFIPLVTNLQSPPGPPSRNPPPFCKSLNDVNGFLAGVF